jgi:citrate lyase alpha subunit
VRNQVRIIVTGYASVGKSAVAQLILETLAAHGITAEFKELHSEDPIKKQLQAQRLDAVAAKSHVVIEERNLYISPEGDFHVAGIGATIEE